MAIPLLIAVQEPFRVMFLLLHVSSSGEKRKYVLQYRSFSDTLAFQRAYTLICKTQCKAGEHLFMGILFAHASWESTYQSSSWHLDTKQKGNYHDHHSTGYHHSCKTLYDLMNNHLSDPAWLDKSLALFAEDCEVIDVPSGMTSRGPNGYKQVILFFEDGFPDSGIEITNMFATENQAAVEFTGRGTNTGPLHMPTGDLPPTGHRRNTLL